MVVCVVGSPRLHPRSFEVAAFLSESINRVIITGRNLRYGSNPMGRKPKDGRTYTRVPLFRGEKAGEKMNRTCPGITYPLGISWTLDYKGLSEP
jgi:hypothetical protein